MQVPADVQARMRRTLGMHPLPRQAGIDALSHALAQDASHLLVLHGEHERLLERVRRTSSAGIVPEAARETAQAPVQEDAAGSISTPVAAKSVSSAREHTETSAQPIVDRAGEGPQALMELAQRYVAGLLAHSLKLSPHRIDVHAPLEQYGIDSVLAMTSTQDLEQVFGPLSKTLFFEYQTIAALTEYFMRRHETKLVSLLNGPSQRGTDTSMPREPVTARAEAA